MTIDIHALSGAYSVDGLDYDERTGFEQHLAQCPTCRDEVDELREAAALLSALTAITPPAGDRAAVLDAISRVRPLPPVTAPASLAARRRWRDRRWWAAGVTLAAAVLAVAVIIRPFSSTPARPSAVSRVMDASDSRQFHQTLSNGERITWYASASLDRVAVVTSSLAEPPTGKVYELWLADDAGTMIPAGFLPTRAGGKAVLRGSLTSATGAGITVEPEGGSKAPTSTPVTVVKFSS